MPSHVLERTTGREASKSGQGTTVPTHKEKAFAVTPRRTWERVCSRSRRSPGQWLRTAFGDLTQRLPRSKKWGIHSASISWAVLIVSFEVAAGGGFTVLDAALDAALRPFVCSGAVELFALGEIRKTTRALPRVARRPSSWCFASSGTAMCSDLGRHRERVLKYRLRGLSLLALRTTTPSKIRKLGISQADHNREDGREAS